MDFSTLASPATITTIPLQAGKKIFFASDFHLGAPDEKSSLIREKNIIRWLEQIRPEAQVIFLVGDIFDFWFEYRNAIPKGFIRLQGKLAELTDSGIPVIFFSGNHDMWMFDYFTRHLNIPILREPREFIINGRKFLIGHGDGLGPGDHTYKILKKIFASKVCQWLFARIHPNTGIAIANLWSRRSRISNTSKGEDKFLGDDEWLLVYCREIERKSHHDFYIFGHRHLPLDIAINSNSRYINLGEWVNYNTYACFDGEHVHLRKFDKSQ